MLHVKQGLGSGKSYGPVIKKGFIGEAIFAETHSPSFLAHAEI